MPGATSSAPGAGSCSATAARSPSSRPGAYSPVAASLLKELGIETQRFYQAYDTGLYDRLGLRTGVFFDRETFGADRLVAGLGKRPWPELLAEAPLTEAARRDIARLYTEKVDYLTGPERRRQAREAAQDQLRRLPDCTRGSGPERPALLPDPHPRPLRRGHRRRLRPHLLSHRGRLRGRGLSGRRRGWGSARRGHPRRREEPYIFHFPDGNASIARLLVSRLVPGALSASGMDDVVTARARTMGASTRPRRRRGSA